MAVEGMINVGFGNFVPAERIVSVVNPDSSPVRRMRAKAKESGRLVDATQGRKTRSIIVTDSNQVVLSNVAPETIAHRYDALAKPDLEANQ